MPAKYYLEIRLKTLEQGQAIEEALNFLLYCHEGNKKLLLAIENVDVETTGVTLCMCLNEKQREMLVSLITEATKVIPCIELYSGDYYEQKITEISVKYFESCVDEDDRSCTCLIGKMLELAN